jgi:translocation and assembly module TamB
MEGLVADAPATASAVLALDRRGLALNQLQADFAGMAIRGQALLADAGPSLDLAFSGRTDKLAPGLGGLVSGEARLRPGAQEPMLDMTAELKRASYQAAVIRSLRAEAHGPLDALAFTVAQEGSAAGSATSLDAKGTLRREGAGTVVRVEATGAVGEDRFRTKSPAILRLEGDRTQLDADLAIGDGDATLRWVDNGALIVEAKLAKAPIRPVAAWFGEPARGFADGTLSVSGDARSLRASYDLTVRDALFARRARDPITMTARGDLQGGRLTSTIDMSSQRGLSLHAEGNAPVSASGHPLRVALDGTGEATWRASGPAQTLWGVVGTLDQAVEGQLEGQGRVRFSRERLSGEGGLTLANGAFADKQTGIELRDVAARLVFDNASAHLESFSARDRRGGALTGSGEATGLSRGRIALAMDNLQILDRPDAKASASGPLALAWTPAGATLEGDVRILEAEIQAPNAVAAAIPQLDVIEINRPDDVEIAETKAAEAQGERLPAFAKTRLKLKVRAPSRVFARGRGLDTEWSLNTELTGDASAPLLFGEARLVRGRFTLANQPFDLDRGYVRFNGSPENAVVDIAATRQADNLSATVNISGEINDPKIALSSTPSLPEDEILPQVLFGRSVQDLSALEAAQLAGSLAQLAGRASMDVTSIARNLVGLDRLDVRDTGSGLRIAGGKYLTRDVYLEVARTAVGETDTAVEWRLRPQFNLVSSFNPLGSNKVSLRWRREY